MDKKVEDSRENAYPVIVGEGGHFRFKDSSGKLSEEFYFADAYHDGFARVKKTDDSGFQFRDRDGKLSEEFFDIFPYHYGFALVQNIAASGFQFRDVDGNFSEEFFDACNYHYGFAKVQKTEESDWQFRDVDGNFSEEFFEAFSYHDGFARVKKTDDSGWQFRDVDGKLSEEFFEIEDYDNGFALVTKRETSSWMHRDILGRISRKETESGKDFYRFKNGEIKIEDLKDDYFADDVFYNGVLEHLKKQYIDYINKKYGEDDILNLDEEVEQASQLMEVVSKKRENALNHIKQGLMVGKKRNEINQNKQLLFDKLNEIFTPAGIDKGE